MKIKIISLSLILIIKCIIINATEINDVTLNGEWTLYYGQFNSNAPSCPDELITGNWPDIPASVPGNVELDLLAAGIIDNPEVGKNIYDLRKYESYQWWYLREFDTPELEPGEQVDLVFEGLDCFGTVWVNNQLVGETDNMFIEHRFNITDLLKKQGKNNIYIKIDPAVPKAQNYITGTMGSRAMLSPEQVNIRKAPHMYGWDIMPRLISAGLWRSVALDIKKPVRIEQVYWMTNSVDVTGKYAQLILDWQIFTGYKTVDGFNMEVILSKDKEEIYKDKYPLFSFCGRKYLSLENVEFWWPKGYGEPNMYDATIQY